MNSPLPTSAGVSVDFLRNKAPFLARDFAMQLAPGLDLAKNYGLTEFEWQLFSQSPQFLELVRVANEELATPEGLIEKIRRKAAVVVERMGILAAAEILNNPNSTAATRLSALSELKDMAGLTKQATQAGMGGVAGPIIQINVSREGKNDAITIGSVEIPPPPPTVGA